MSRQDGQPEKQFRVLMVSYRVIKILSTKRLTGDRKIFQDMAKQIFDYLQGLRDALFAQWKSSGCSGGALQRAHYALKILRMLCVRGYKTAHESDSVKKFIFTVMQRAKETLEIRSQRQDTSALLEKHIISMWKVVADLLEATIGGRSSVSMATPETNPLTLEAHELKQRFFTDTTLPVLVRVLATRYLPLTQVEKESWNEDPEEFALRMEESGETWKYNLRF